MGPGPSTATARAEDPGWRWAVTGIPLHATEPPGDRRGRCSPGLASRSEDPWGQPDLRPARRAGPGRPAQMSFFSTPSGACFITGAIAAHGSGGTQASATSFSIAATIACTPFSVEDISGVDCSTLSFISERM